MTQTATIIQSGTWELDPTHTEIGFTVRHLMSKVRGTFEEFQGTIVTVEDVSQSKATAAIKLASINTGTPDRDTHLRSSDFFGVEENQTMTFEATSIVGAGNDFVVGGTLTIKDVAKPVELKVELLGVGSDPWGGTRVGFEAHAEISRKEWGIDFNIPVQGEKLMIGDKVSINIVAEAVLQA